MTRFKAQVVKVKQKFKEETIRVGVYIATFSNKDDRLLVFSSLGDLKSVINLEVNDDLYIQRHQNETNYTNFKKVKNLTFKIEVE